jgi:putative two-component system response regulator
VAKQQHTILIVDDAPHNLEVLGELLQPLYRVRVANSGERALRSVLIDPMPDLILLDVMMPGIDGYEVLRQLREDPQTREIPVIFITAMSSGQDEEKGLELGAVDYIGKPFSPAIVLARVRTHLELKQARDRLASRNKTLAQEVDERMHENLLIQDLSVRALACLGEARDNETGNHILRTQAYVRLLARHLADHPEFKAALDDGRLEKIVQAAPLHDIGKVGVPDAILLKPGPLTKEEFEVMKGHPEIGARAIDKAMEQARSGDLRVESETRAFAFLQVAREICISHHEKWDGSGYPYGLRGAEIPVAGRLMALADVFDALITARVYKPAFDRETATTILREGRGTHFDPVVVDAFLEMEQEFADIARQYADGSS